jgi:hypothetical protein
MLKLENSGLKIIPASSLEKRLLDAGFKKLDANRYEHPDGRLLFRDQRVGAWYLRSNERAPRRVGKTLREAIQVVLGE